MQLTNQVLLKTCHDHPCYLLLGINFILVFTPRSRNRICNEKLSEKRVINKDYLNQLIVELESYRIFKRQKIRDDAVVGRKKQRGESKRIESK